MMAGSCCGEIVVDFGEHSLVVVGCSYIDGWLLVICS